MIAGIVGIFLQIQAGVAVKPETVTVGQHFTTVVRVRAPRGATIQFPVGTTVPAAVDTAAPAIRRDTTTADYMEATTTFVLAAWDTGRVALGLGDVVVETERGERRIPLSANAVYVRSVLPRDTTLRTPKPPRPVVTVTPFNWWPYIIAAIVAAILGLAAMLWAWYRRRSRRPVIPISWAEREFSRIEALRLLESGQPEQHAILMAGVLRGYLSRRVAGIRTSATTRELANTLRMIPTVPYERTLRVFESVDLLKFARQSMGRDHAQAIGAESRAIVKTIEAQAREAAEAAAKAAGETKDNAQARAA